MNKEIPLASNAVAIVREAFKRRYGDKIDYFVDLKVNELCNVYKLTQGEFETELLACSLLDKTLVLQTLNELYNLRYPISLFYEIVAHLFKHRFIDVIINFNFDEMLDNVIEEEMADSQYRFIYSDGHCPEDASDLLYDNRLAFPYI